MKHGDPGRPPRVAYAILTSILPEEYREAVLGDAVEEFRRRIHDPRDRRFARLRFWALIVHPDLWRLRLEARNERKNRIAGRKGPMGNVGSTEIRQAFTLLRRSPWLAAAVVLTLAIGIGANTAIFSIADALMLRSLPVRHADRLAFLGTDGTWSGAAVSYPIWESIRDRERLHDGAFAFTSSGFNLSESGLVDPVEGLQASGRMFDVLGVDALLGRTFNEADDRIGGGPDGAVAVISHGFWQRRYGGEADVIGTSITLDGVPFTIVGVTPAHFFGPDVGRSFDVAVPLGTLALLNGSDALFESRGSWWLRVVLRMAPDQSTAEATSALRAVQSQIADETRPFNQRPEDAAAHFTRPLTVLPATSGVSELRETYRLPVLVLMAIVALTLLVACGNVANLMLARSNRRRSELSLRSALGASGRRLARQLMTESVLLAAAGAALGVVLAFWGGRLILALFSTAESSVFLDVGVDGRLLAFSGVLAIGTALLFGTAPALRASRVAPMDILRDARRGGSSGRRRNLSNALVVGQAALSVVLLVGAGLFIRTFRSLTTMELGIEPERVLLVHMGSPGAGIDPDARAPMYRQILDEVRSVPEVSQAALSMITPLAGQNTTRFMEFPGQPELPEPERRVWLNLVTSGWFDALGTTLLEGRDFDGRDRLDSPPVVIVNRTAVDRYFQGESPLGRTIRQRPRADGSEFPPMTIVGVVEDAVYRSVREPVPPTMYWPLEQQERIPNGLSLVIQSSGSLTSGTGGRVGEVVSGVNPELSLVLRPLSEEVEAALTQERLLATLAGFFGGLALLLAALGIYGVTAYSASQRRIELGIRLALGTTRGRVIGLVIGRTVALVAGGIAIGMGMAWWGSGLVRGLLFELSPHDPLTLVAAVGLLIGVAVLAGWVPATRAARADPAHTLREG